LNNQLEKLLNSNFGAAHTAATKASNFALVKLNHTVFCGVNREVARQESAGPCALSHTNLTDNYIAGLNNLAAKNLNA
jgi:hypothetical protein